MERKFEETKIPEDVSKAMADNNFIMGAIHAGKVIKVLGTGISKFLGDVKSLEVPMALRFSKMDGSFLAGMKVEYHKNPDDPENPSAGNWSYVWTFKEEDLEGANVTDFAKSVNAFSHFIACGAKLYNMRFQDHATASTLFNTFLEHVYHWLDDNAVEGEENTLIADGVFIAKCEVKDGKIIKAIIPDGNMKVLIKGDDLYQEAV